jgi:hypothetical protein
VRRRNFLVVISLSIGFGGAYTNSTSFLPGSPGYAAYAAPTVITAGKLLSAALISTTTLPSGMFDLDATITLTAAQAQNFSSGFDVFWGTGDCANGSFLAEIPVLGVMEPASFLALVVGASAVMVARRAGPPTMRARRDAFPIQNES